MKSRTLHFECQRIKTLMQPLSQGLHLPLSDTLFGCCCSLFQSLQLKYFTDIFLVNSTSMLSLRFFGKIKVCGTVYEASSSSKVFDAHHYFLKPNHCCELWSL